MSQEQVIAALDAAKWDMREAMRLLQAESKKPVVKELEPKAFEKEKPHKIEHEKEPEAFRDRSFLERSAILGKELNELIRAQQAEADPDLIFKRELEKKLRIGPEDVPGLPGMVPLTKKMIDNLRAAKPVDEEGEKGTHEVAKPAPLDKECKFTLIYVVAHSSHFLQPSSLGRKDLNFSLQHRLHILM